MPRFAKCAVVLSLLCPLGCGRSTTPAPTPAAVNAARASATASRESPAGLTSSGVVVNKAPEVDQIPNGQAPVSDSPQKPPQTAEELVEHGENLLQKRDAEGATKAFEQALKLSPDDRQVLLLVVSATQSRALELAQKGKRIEAVEWFLKSADTMRKLQKNFGPLSEREESFLVFALYNEACAEAISGHAERSLSILNEVLDLGWNNLEQIDDDDDLKSVRELPNFAEFRESAVLRVKARAAKHAQKLLAEHQPFPFQFTLPNLDGQDVSLGDYAGKVLIVDIWGTWCPPCRQEIPHFVMLHETYRDRGLDIVGLNYERGDPGESVPKIRSFVEKQRLPYQCLIGDRETQMQVPDFSGFPTTLFLDRSGKVRLSVVGYHSYFDLEAIVLTLLDDIPAASNEKTALDEKGTGKSE